MNDIRGIQWWNLLFILLLKHWYNKNLNSVQVIKSNRIFSQRIVLLNYLVPPFKSFCHNWFNLWGAFWRCCTTLRFVPPLSDHTLWKEERTSVALWNRLIGLMKSHIVDYVASLQIPGEAYPRTALGRLIFDLRLKDCICLVWLETRANPTARHFLVLWDRVVDDRIVKVILHFYWFSLCCRNHSIVQIWEVFIHGTRKWLSGSEVRRTLLEDSPESHVFLVHLRSLVVTSGPTMQVSVGLT